MAINFIFCNSRPTKFWSTPNWNGQTNIKVSKHFAMTATKQNPIHSRNLISKQKYKRNCFNFQIWMAINNQINFLPGTSITAWQGYPHCRKAQSTKLKERSGKCRESLPLTWQNKRQQKVKFLFGVLIYKDTLYKDMHTDWEKQFAN